MSENIIIRTPITEDITKGLRAGALLSKCITKSELVCYEDLGAEAIRKIEVEKFPVIVVIDSEGNNLYEQASKEFCAL